MNYAHILMLCAAWLRGHRATFWRPLRSALPTRCWRGTSTVVPGAFGQAERGDPGHAGRRGGANHPQARHVSRQRIGPHFAAQRRLPPRSRRRACPHWRRSADPPCRCPVRRSAFSRICATLTGRLVSACHRRSSVLDIAVQLLPAPMPVAHHPLDPRSSVGYPVTQIVLQMRLEEYHGCGDHDQHKDAGGDPICTRPWPELLGGRRMTLWSRCCVSRASAGSTKSR